MKALTFILWVGLLFAPMQFPFAQNRDTSDSIGIIEIGEESKLIDSIATIVEYMPEFPGGSMALMKFIHQNLNYPEQARKDSIEGRVFVNFIVHVHYGTIDQVKIVRGVHPLLDSAAVEVIKKMPRWKSIPTNAWSKHKYVLYCLPVRFKL